MKIALSKTGHCSGNILMVTILTAFIIGTVLASYLALVRYQNATVARAQDWNAAMGAAEAGVEEALAQLTHVPLTTNINRSANGWVIDGSICRVPAPRAILHGAYNVWFTNVAQPVIVASGKITNSALATVITRTVEVRTTNAPVYSVGLAAIYNIKMNGNKIYADSYISTDSNYSTDGRYDPAKARSNGDVASVNGLIDVGNGDVHGDLLTGPTGSYATNKNGSFSGTYLNDFNPEYQEAKDPVDLNKYLTPSAGMVNQKITTGTGLTTKTITYDYAFGNSAQIKLLSGLTGSLYVGPNANVSLYICDNVNISANQEIYIEKGGKLTIYMAGKSFVVGGTVNNATPASLNYIGLPNNTTIALKGNAGFTGTIYAPRADLQLDGGGSPNNTVDFSGACVTKSISMNGHLNFHYDEALAKLGPSIYKAISWREL